MTDLKTRLSALCRPPLLVEAARSGMAGYIRETHLSRALGVPPRGGVIGPAPALEELLLIEADLNAQRRRSDAGYSYLRHVEVLIALMSEARLLGPAPAPNPAHA